MKITFNITPKATPRPRVAKFGVYYPKEYQAYRKILEQLAPLLCKKHFKGVISMRIDFYMQIPASLSKIKREALIEQYHIKKPDCDNLAKGIKDCLEGIAYDNDSQIAELHITKRYDTKPRIEVELWEL